MQADGRPGDGVKQPRESDPQPGAGPSAGGGLVDCDAADAREADAADGARRLHVGDIDPMHAG